jgi:hypothetical protein
MKTTIKFLLVTLIIANISYSQNIAINSTGLAANLSSMLDITSGASGTLGLLIPRMTNAQRTGIVILPAAAQGLVVYQTNTVGSSLEGFYYNTSTTTTPIWNYLTSGGWSLTGNAGTLAGTNFIGTTDAIDWVVKTNNTEQMRVLSGGNVGIGIAAATQKLDVQGGNARINNVFIGDVGHGSGWGGISHSSMANTTGYALIESNDGAYTLINKQNTGTGWIGFRVANNDVAVITNAGNMGIGTTAPGQLFSVGSGNQFQVNSTGNLVKINNVPYSWPASQGAANTRLTNNGSGTLSWSSGSSLGQGFTQSSATGCTRYIGDNTSGYSSTGVCSSGYSTGTWFNVAGLSITRTITTGNIVAVNVHIRWKTDNAYYWAPETIWFRILRDGAEIARSSMFTQDPDWLILEGDGNIFFYDSGASAGAHTYSVQTAIANNSGGTESYWVQDGYITLMEIAQ